MSTVVISIRIRKEIKELLEKSGIDITEEVKKHLEELAYRIRLREYISRWDILLREIKPSPKKFAAESVREDRESH